MEKKVNKRKRLLVAYIIGHFQRKTEGIKLNVLVDGVGYSVLYVLMKSPGKKIDGYSLHHLHPTESANGLSAFTVRRTVLLTGFRDVHVEFEAAGSSTEDLICQSAGRPEV